MDTINQPQQSNNPPSQERTDFSTYLTQAHQESQKPVTYEKNDAKNFFGVFLKGHPLIIAGLIVIFTFFITLFLFTYLLSNRNAIKLPPDAKIINEPGMPPRLETPIFPKK